MYEHVDSMVFELIENTVTRNQNHFMNIRIYENENRK